MSNIHNLKVGQQVWQEPERWSRSSVGRYVEIIKVGRDWATTKAGGGEIRFSLETLVIDGRGFSSPGRVWLTKEEWETDLEMKCDWGDIRSIASGPIPKHLTHEQIRSIIKTIKPPKENHESKNPGH